MKVKKIFVICFLIGIIVGAITGIILNVVHLDLQYLIAISITTGIIIGLIVGLILRKGLTNNKTISMTIDEVFMKNLITLLGEIDNVKSVDVVNKRLKIDVKSVKLVDVKEIHQIATKGVFVTSNSLKMVFPYESEMIKNELDKLIKK